MRITNPRYLLNQFRPTLAMEIDGVEVFMSRESIKPALETAGWLYVGLDDELPPIRFTPAGERKAQTLRGFTDDPQVWALWHAFLVAAARDDFTPGPVTIPGV